MPEFGPSPWQPAQRGAHHVAFGRLPQQSPKGDDRGHAGTVEEEEGRQALQAESIAKVARVPQGSALHVPDEPSTEPRGKNNSCHCSCRRLPAARLLQPISYPLQWEAQRKAPPTREGLT